MAADDETKVEKHPLAFTFEHLALGPPKLTSSPFFDLLDDYLPPRRMMKVGEFVTFDPGSPIARMADQWRKIPITVTDWDVDAQGNQHYKAQISDQLSPAEQLAVCGDLQAEFKQLIDARRCGLCGTEYPRDGLCPHCDA